MKILTLFNTNNEINQISTMYSSDNLNTKHFKRFAYPVLLIFLVLISLLFIEFKHPYFFLQDDNRDSYLPYFINNYKSLIKGELSLYNFHQFLGTPSLAKGQTAVLYPITYLSVFLSNLIFKHYFAAIDIQVIIHLIIGSIGFYSFLRFFKTDYKAALLGGLTWSLSSFIIFVSNSWVIVAAVAAYFPWMLFFSFQLYKNTSLNIIIYGTIVRLLFFYVGHVQYFIYSVIFEFITTILYVVSDTLPGSRKFELFKFLRKYIKCYTFVFILSLPLLLPMWHQTSISGERSGQLPFSEFISQHFPITQLFEGLFYPFLQVDENTYASFRNMLNLSHIGYITLIFLLIGIIEKFIKKTKNITIHSVRLSVFVRPALIAFLWTTNLLFNMFIYTIPILNRFRWPFKLALYFDFYLIIIGALIFSHIISDFSLKKVTTNILFILIVGIQIFNFIFLYTGIPYKDFGEHHGDTLPLEEKLQSQLTDGRIISIGFDIWSPTSENNHSYLTAPSLGFNYATLWGLDYFAGYDTLIPSKNAEACLGLNFTAIIDSNAPIPIDYLRKAAVKWYIVPKTKVNEYTEKLMTYGITKKYEDENRVVFYDSKAYPMIFNSIGQKIESKNYKFTTNNIDLSVNTPNSETIIFNNIYNPFFEGYIDGEKTKLTPINDINFSISIPEGKHHILIKYKDPYLTTGIYCAIAFLILVLVIQFVLKKRNIQIKFHNKIIFGKVRGD